MNSASADDYIGASVGQSEIDLTGYDYGFFYKIYGGVRKKYYGFEGNYTRLARFDITGANTGSVNASGIGVSVISFLPLTSNFEVFIKVGFFSWSATGRINGSLLSKNQGTNSSYAFGAQYNATENVTLRAEYQRFKGVLGDNISSISTGISYRI